MDKAILENFISQGLSQREIGRRLHLSQTTTRYWLKKFGLTTKKEQKTTPCESCGRAIVVDLSYRTRKFCSNRCQQDKAWAERKEIILSDGEARGGTSKRFVRERDGNKCSICGLETWCGKPAPLVLDHIDGNSENNQLENFRLVCGNCDMQLPTYKGRNKGNGRAWRRARYAEGKSY